jgi:hypothetical protein
MTGRLPRLEDGGVLAGVKAKSEWTGLRPGLDPDCGRRPNAVSGSQGKIYNATRSKTTNLGSLRFQGIAALATFGHEAGRLRGDGGKIRAPSIVAGCGEHPA